MSSDHVLSLDVGTTTIKACIFDREGALLGRHSAPVATLTPRPGWSEVEPAGLWADIRAALTKVGCKSNIKLPKLHNQQWLSYTTSAPFEVSC